MIRTCLVLGAMAVLLWPGVLPAGEGNDGPPIAITSPDTATTFAYGSIKEHILLWKKAQHVLVARITFIDVDQAMGPSNDDQHDFRLPGVTFDEAKGLFFATSSQGEVIPVARIKKALFFNTVETTPNARVRVLHPRGIVTVILEAISPDDPAMHTAPPASNPDGTHPVNLDNILQ